MLQINDMLRKYISIMLLCSAIVGLCGGLIALIINFEFLERHFYRHTLGLFLDAFNKYAGMAAVMAVSYYGISRLVVRYRRSLRWLVVFLCLGATLLVVLVNAILLARFNQSLISISHGNLVLSVPVVIAGLSFLTLLILLGLHLASRKHNWPRGRFLPALAVVVLLGVNLSISAIRFVLSPPTPNVLIISVDTLRADHLGCYGYQRDTSPVLDAFASESLRFAETVVPMSHTLPSHLSLLTGLDIQNHGVRSNSMKLEEGVATLAELLATKGYDTGAVVGSSVLAHDRGLSRGFSFYDDEMDVNDGEEYSRRASSVRERAVEWLRRSRTSQFFLFVHFWDPHQPYYPPPPFDKQFSSEKLLQGISSDLHPYDNDQPYRKYYPSTTEADLRKIQNDVDSYDGEIRYVDSEISVLFDALKQTGLWDETLIVVTADHGESIGERGWWGHELFYEEQVLVPLLIKLPGQESPTGVIEAPVRLVDLTPTVLEYLRLPNLLDLDGTGLAEYWEGESARSRTALIERRRYPDSMQLKSPERWGMGDEYAIRNETWKYIMKEREEDELYNLIDDPMELNNVIGTNEQTASLLREELQQLLFTAPQPQTDAENTIDLENLRVLKSLGYIQ